MKRDSKKESEKVNEKQKKVYQKPVLTKYRQLKKVIAVSPVGP